MNTRPGRNAPCYCGSGKKYKRCHLPLDETSRSAPALTRAAEHAPSREDLKDFAPGSSAEPGHFKSISEVFKLAASSGLMKRDAGLWRIFKDKTFLTYLGRQQEIEAACAKLEPYEEEFQRLLNDDAASQSRSAMLFGEEPFAALRFTAADVETAFQKVGFPRAVEATEEIHKVYRDALLFLCSKEHRNHLAMELLMRVPQYVKDSRFIDARLIVLSADLTADERIEVNPFLLCMFYYGLQTWTSRQEREEKKVLQEMGLEIKEGMTPDEIDAWLAEQQADPVKTARLEKFVDAHPEVRVRSIGNLDVLHRNSVSLLDRKDAAVLLLRAEEIEPWVPFLIEKLQLMAEKYGLAEGDAPLSDTQQREAFNGIYLPAMREVTKGIFSPERIRKLVAELKGYRRQLFDAGEKKAAYHATGAINYVEREDDPSQNVFLVNLCAKSLPGAGSPSEREPGADEPLVPSATAS